MFFKTHNPGPDLYVSTYPYQTEVSRISDHDPLPRFPINVLLHYISLFLHGSQNLQRH